MVMFFACTAAARQSFTSDSPVAWYCQTKEEQAVPSRAFSETMLPCWLRTSALRMNAMSLQPANEFTIEFSTLVHHNSSGDAIERAPVSGELPRHMWCSPVLQHHRCVERCSGIHNGQSDIELILEVMDVLQVAMKFQSKRNWLDLGPRLHVPTRCLKFLARLTLKVLSHLHHALGSSCKGQHLRQSLIGGVSQSLMEMLDPPQISTTAWWLLLRLLEKLFLKSSSRNEHLRYSSFLEVLLSSFNHRLSKLLGVPTGKLRDCCPFAMNLGTSKNQIVSVVPTAFSTATAHHLLGPLQSCPLP